MTEVAATRVRVELVAGRARFVELRGGTFLRPRPLTVDGPVARLALVGSYATLLAGDDLRIEVDVGPGVWLELVEPSGTVAYDAQGGEAHWSARLSVAEGGRLVWRGAPFVVTAGANLRRDTRVSIADGARALLSETLVLGRSYEDGGGPLRSTMRVDHGGRPLLVEDFDLRELGHRERPGIMADNRAMTSVLLLGARPDTARDRHETRFAGEGALARALARHAHEAEAAVAGAWSTWRDEFTDPDRHRAQASQVHSTGQAETVSAAGEPDTADGSRAAVGALAGGGRPAAAPRSPHRSAAATRPTGPVATRPTGPAATRQTGPAAARPTGPAATRPTGPAATRPTGPAAARPTDAAAVHRSAAEARGASPTFRHRSAAESQPPPPAG